MIIVRETTDGLAPIGGNPTLTSLDGMRRAPLRTILHHSWTDAERAAFGIFLIEPMAIPEGKRRAGPPAYERRGGKVVEVLPVEDIPLPADREPTKAETALTAWAEGLGLSLADVRAALVQKAAR